MGRPISGVRAVSRGLVIALVILVIASCLNTVKAVKVKKLDREVDLTTQSLIIASSLTLKNDEKESLKSFVYCATKITQGRKLIWAEFDEGDSGDDGSQDTKKLEWTIDDKECAKVTLSTPLPKGKETIVEIFEVFTLDLVPAHSTIEQSAPQLMKFDGFDVVVQDSNLEIDQQTTKIYLPSATVPEYTKVKPSKKGSKELTYGPYKAGKLPSDSIVTIVVEYPEPALVIESVVKDVTVSSWTDIQVEEHYHIKNTGPAFKDGFSRAEYSRNPKSYVANTFSLHLPKQAHSLFYQDVLGNITTSNTRFESSKVSVEAVPRFPLIGGWQTHFTFGYSLPTSAFVKSSGLMGKTLVMDVLPSLQNAYIKNLTINTAVPEFSTKVGGGVLTSSTFFTASDPFRTVKTSSGKKNHYFDLFGRPMQTLELSNISPELADVGLEFYVKYNFNDLMKFKEPAMLLAFLAVIMSLVFLCSKADFPLVKKEKSD